MVANLQLNRIQDLLDFVGGLTDGYIIQAQESGGNFTFHLVNASNLGITGYQPLDSDLTAIAALTTASFGRGSLTQTDAASFRTYIGLGTAATQNSTAFDAAGAAAAALVTAEAYTDSAIATRQPLDSDLTAIAALSTTSFGRGSLTQVDAAAFRTYIGSVIGTDVQPQDPTLQAMADLWGFSGWAIPQFITFTDGPTAAVSSPITVFALSLVDDADAATARATLGLGSAALSSSGDFQPIDSDLTAIAALTTTSFGRGSLTQTDAAAFRTYIGAGTSSGANPSASVGLTAVNGSASTFLRSDGAPALDQSIAPTWTGVHTWSVADNTTITFKRASSGSHTVAIAFGAGGQSTTLKSDDVLQVGDQSQTRIDGTSSRVQMGSGVQLTWYNANWTNTADLALTRSGTGTMKVTDAGSGLGAVICGQPATGTIGAIVKGIASRTVALLQLQSSAGASLGNCGGTIFSDFADGSSTHTDGTYDDLFTHTTVANTLANNGDSIRGTIGLSFVNSGSGNREVKLVFAGTTIYDSGVFLSSACQGQLDYTIIRVSSTVVRYTVRMTGNGYSSGISSPIVLPTTVGELTGLTLTGTNILKVTGAASGFSAASGDITGKMQVMDRGEAP
jgi:hypothetical protein